MQQVGYTQSKNKSVQQELDEFRCERTNTFNRSSPTPFAANGCSVFKWMGEAKIDSPLSEYNSAMGVIPASTLLVQMLGPYVHTQL